MEVPPAQAVAAALLWTRATTRNTFVNLCRREPRWNPEELPPEPGYTLEPQDDRHTLMTIHHALLPPKLIGGHQQGWTRIAEQLDDILRVRS